MRMPLVSELLDRAYDDGRDFDPAVDMPSPAEVERLNAATHLQITTGGWLRPLDSN